MLVCSLNLFTPLRKCRYKEFIDLKRRRGLSAAPVTHFDWQGDCLRDERQIEEEINDMQDELKTLKDLHAILQNNNSGLQYSDFAIEFEQSYRILKFTL